MVKQIFNFTIFSLLIFKFPSLYADLVCGRNLAFCHRCATKSSVMSVRLMLNRGTPVNCIPVSKVAIQLLTTLIMQQSSHEAHNGLSSFPTNASTVVKRIEAIRYDTGIMSHLYQSAYPHNYCTLRRSSCFMLVGEIPPFDVTCSRR